MFHKASTTIFTPPCDMYVSGISSTQIPVFVIYRFCRGQLVYLIAALTSISLTIDDVEHPFVQGVGVKHSPITHVLILTCLKLNRTTGPQTLTESTENKFTDSKRFTDSYDSESSFIFLHPWLSTLAVECPFKRTEFKIQ